MRLISVLLIGSALIVSAGTRASATTTGSPFSWGVFEAARAIATPVSAPNPIDGVPGMIKQIATSNSDTYILTTAGTVWAIGAGDRGELGDGQTSDSMTMPVPVPFPAGVSIADLPDPMPFDTGLAIDTAGNAWGWGFNDAGQLCLGSTTVQLRPVLLPFSDVTLASGAGLHSVFDAAGAIYVCGSNADGALGDGSTVNSVTPVAVEGLPKGQVTALTSSFMDSGAMLSDGSYWDWGLNDLGQLGNGSLTNSDVPVPVHLPSAGSSVSQGGGEPKRARLSPYSRPERSWPGEPTSTANCATTGRNRWSCRPSRSSHLPE